MSFRIIGDTLTIGCYLPRAITILELNRKNSIRTKNEPIFGCNESHHNRIPPLGTTYVVVRLPPRFRFLFVILFVVYRGGYFDMLKLGEKKAKLTV